MQRKKLSSQTGLSSEDSELFRQSIAGARPLMQDKIAPVSVPGKKKARQVLSAAQDDKALFFFSDAFEGFVSDSATLSFVQPGEDPHLARRLKRAEYQPQVLLDLHGLTQQQAKTELAGLLEYCQQQQFNCACVPRQKAGVNMVPCCCY
mgnify:FL=1